MYDSYCCFAFSGNHTGDAAEEAASIPTYSEAFPPLATNGESSEASSKSSGEWHTPKIQRFKS